MGPGLLHNTATAVHDLCRASCPSILYSCMKNHQPTVMDPSVLATEGDTFAAAYKLPSHLRKEWSIHDLQQVVDEIRTVICGMLKKKSAYTH